MCECRHSRVDGERRTVEVGQTLLLSGFGGQGENTGSPNLSPGLPRMWGVEFSQSF